MVGSARLGNRRLSYFNGRLRNFTISLYKFPQPEIEKLESTFARHENYKDSSMSSTVSKAYSVTYHFLV